MRNPFREYVGIKDIKGKRIYVGDKVIMAWGWQTSNNKLQILYQIHTVNIKYDEIPRIKLYCLGNSYNVWRNRQVTKLSRKYLQCFKDIPEDHYFYYNEFNKPIAFK